MNPIHNLLEAQEACRNLSDMLSLDDETHDGAALDLELGLLAYTRSRQLDRQRSYQERAWDQQAAGGGWVSIALMLALTAGATFATVCGWFWWSAFLAVGIASVAYVMILATGEADESPTV